jgi:uncharacterized protein DUF3310
VNAVDHPAHYGGDEPYEVIKVIEAWELGFHLGNAVKYIARAGKKNPDKAGEDLDKAVWYIQRFLETEFEKLKRERRSLAEEEKRKQNVLATDALIPRTPEYIDMLRSECQRLLAEETRKRGTDVRR